MGASKTKQAKGVNETALGQVGGQKVRLSREFKPAAAAMNKEAMTDRGDLFRSRQAADVAKIDTDSSYNTLSGGNQRLRVLSELENMKNESRGGALSLGSIQGEKMQLANHNSAMAVALGAGATTSSNMKSIATQEYQNNAVARQITDQANNDRAGAGMGIASLGAGKYMEGQNAQLQKDNQAAYAAYKAEAGAGADSFANWSQATRGQTNGFNEYHSSGFKNFLNNFAGVG